MFIVASQRSKIIEIKWWHATEPNTRIAKK